jgi:hypothetical protein
MDSLTATVKAVIQATATKTRDFGTLTWPFNYTKSVSFTSGAGADQVNEMYDDYRSLADGANEELDLSGTLVNAFGDTVAFTGIKAFYIENTSLTVGGAAATPWEPWAGAAGDTFKVAPGGLVMMTAPSATGWAVAAGSTDKLKILNSAGAATTYRIVLIGDLS